MKKYLMLCLALGLSLNALAQPPSTSQDLWSGSADDSGSYLEDVKASNDEIPEANLKANSGVVFGSVPSSSFSLRFIDSDGNTVSNPVVGGTYRLAVDYLGPCGGVNPAYRIVYTYGTNAQYYAVDATCGDTTFNRQITIGSSPYVVTVAPLARPGSSGPYIVYTDYAQSISNAINPGDRGNN